MRNHNIGSVSSGTMLPKDLIPSFIRELKRQKPCHRSHRSLIRGIEASIEKGIGTNQDYWESDQCHEDLESLFNALEDYAPAYFYFGAHPGDGTDYGYWLSESFEEDFDGLKVSDTSEVPHGYHGEVLHVNDHGNMSLYRAVRGRLYECWAIV